MHEVYKNMTDAQVYELAEYVKTDEQQELLFDINELEGIATNIANIVDKYTFDHNIRRYGGELRVVHRELISALKSYIKSSNQKEK